MAPPEKRSPLKEKPLRNPGETLERQLDRVLNDELLPWLTLPFLAVGITALEWWRSIHPVPPRPGLYAVIAAGAVALSVYKIVTLLKRVRKLQLGLQGEKVVGQQLEALREQKCRVFHDIPAPGFNLDHVLVGPMGIFVVQTKTRSKPVDRDAKITLDGDGVRVDGYAPDRDCLRQTAAERDWLQQHLLESTATRFRVRGVLVFPGWWVEPAKGKPDPDLWVLNPKALPAFLRNEPVVLNAQEIALVCSRLESYVRSQPAV